MRILFLLLVLCVSCRSRLPGEAETSTYKPSVSPALIHPQGVQDSASGTLTDPGSPKSPQVQQLPQASP